MSWISIIIIIALVLACLLYLFCKDTLDAQRQTQLISEIEYDATERIKTAIREELSMTIFELLKPAAEVGMLVEVNDFALSDLDVPYFSGEIIEIDEEDQDVLVRDECGNEEWIPLMFLEKQDDSE